MAYKVTFTGDRKPETLTDTDGKELYDDWKAGDLPERVELRPGLTLQSRTIKEIEYVRTTNTEDAVYTRQELDHFERDKLAPFLKEGKLSLHDELAFYASEGIISLRVYHTPARSMSDVQIAIRSHLLKDFITTTNKVDQWRTRRGKREYGVRMRNRELDLSMGRA